MSFFQWHLDADTRRAMRLDKVREALLQRDFLSAIQEAEELLDHEPDNLEALWMMSQATLEVGDYLTAREIFRRLVELSPSPTASLYCHVANVSFECGALDEAKEAAERAIALNPEAAAAHHLLGLLAERESGPSAAAEHFLLAHRLSPEHYPLPLRLSKDDWSLLLADAFAALPIETQSFWEEVPVSIEDFPSDDTLAQAKPPVSPKVPAMYIGEPPPVLTGNERPQELKIFRGNLAHCDDETTLTLQLAQVLQQEALPWLAES